jgi:hypothetical protein
MTDKVTTVGVSVDFRTKALEIAYEMTRSYSYRKGSEDATGRAEHIRQLVEIMTTPSKPTEMLDPGSHSVYTG